MNPNDIAKELRDEIARSKDITSDVDIHEVFMSAETIISCLAYLISPIAEMEQTYRKLAIPNPQQTNAAAEAIAKASDEYKNWRKMLALYDLSHEQLMLLKKFRQDLESEKQRI